MSTRTGLVLAGGGLAGIAWELGVLRGLADVDPDLAAAVIGADVVVGTSAGSTVAAQITGGATLDDLYDAQLVTSRTELEVDVDLEALLTAMGPAIAEATSPTDARRRIGAIALATDTVDEAARRAAVAARLPTTTWPERTVLIPAVDAGSGEVAVFDRASGVSLTDAVTASCAVPGVWPPVSIGGRRYVDGGVRSNANADLARGCDLVLVLSPADPDAPLPWGDLDAELASLAPARVDVIHPDAASLAAFGTNPLSPATRRPSAEAGRTVGRDRADALTAWSTVR